MNEHVVNRQYIQQQKQNNSPLQFFTILDLRRSKKYIGLATTFVCSMFLFFEEDFSPKISYNKRENSHRRCYFKVFLFFFWWIFSISNRSSHYPLARARCARTVRFVASLPVNVGRSYSVYIIYLYVNPPPVITELFIPDKRCPSGAYARPVVPVFSFNTIPPHITFFPSVRMTVMRGVLPSPVQLRVRETDDPCRTSGNTHSVERRPPSAGTWTSRVR